FRSTAILECTPNRVFNVAYLFFIILEPFPPFILGPRSLDVRHDQSYNLRIEANSISSNDLTYSLVASHDPAFNMTNNKTGDFIFAPIYANETVTFNVVDEFGNAGTYVPQIKYCYCLNGGTCTEGAVEAGDKISKCP
ncbi:MAG: hypothetical protein AAF570_18785, partial [Bacteroidota bacterium]